MFKIESNLPIPESKWVGRTPKYPWKQMKVGDSFLVPTTPDVCNKIVRQRLSVGAYKSSCGKFATRIVNEGVRVWRVE